MESADPSPSEPTANRLSIGHLLLWTATTAAMLALVRSQVASSPAFEQGSPPPRAAQELWLLELLAYAMAPAFGAALAALILAGWRSATSTLGFPILPGHWLLLMVAAVPLAHGVIVLASSIDTSGVFWVIVLAFGWEAAICVSAARQCNRLRRWRLTFTLAAVGFILATLVGLAQLLIEDREVARLVGILGIIAGLSLVGSLFAALVSGVLDLFAQTRFDIFHWTGLACLAIVAALQPLASCAIFLTLG